VRTFSLRAGARAGVASSRPGAAPGTPQRGGPSRECGAHLQVAGLVEVDVEHDARAQQQLRQVALERVHVRDLRIPGCHSGDRGAACIWPVSQVPKASGQQALHTAGLTVPAACTGCACCDRKRASEQLLCPALPAHRSMFPRCPSSDPSSMLAATLL